MKYMITSKEKHINHPINYVYTNLESFVLFSDSLNDIDSQIVEANDIPEITENFREILKREEQEKQKMLGNQLKAMDNKQSRHKKQISSTYKKRKKAYGPWILMEQ